MMMTVITSTAGRLALALTILAAVGANATATPVSEPFTLAGPDGSSVAGQLTTLMVPESRARPESRMIPLRYVRLPSITKTPGYPVVYLAGGPGGSAVRNGQGARFGFFNRLREVGEVILLEQRGAGLSNTLPPCDVQLFDSDRPLDRDNFTEAYRHELTRCIAFWRAKGVAVEGYNTLESAADLETLRAALGVTKLNLVGLSYGTHLGMAAMKRGNAIHRAVFAGLEGVDQTVKLPATGDAFFARVAAAVDADPAASAAYPDLVAMMRRVHQRLADQPVPIDVKLNDGSPTRIRLGLFPIQLLTGSLYIPDPTRIGRLPALYAEMDAGNFQPAGETIVRAIQSEFGSMDGMPQLMDLASGVSEKRLRLTQRQARTALLGDSQNFPMPQIRDIDPGLILPDDFRKPFRTAVPTLLIMATMDGRTPIESQEELLPVFRNASRLTVINGGHNIFEQSEEVQRAIVHFLIDGRAETTSITLPAVKFELPKRADSSAR